MIYTLKLTDHHLYFYHAKKRELIKEKIAYGIINELRINDVKKTIRILEKFLKENKFNEGLFKVKINILVSKIFSPAELFLFEYVGKALINANCHLFFEESLINDSNEIIIWDNYLNLVNQKQIISITNKENLPKPPLGKKTILLGVSDHYEEYKITLNNHYKINILEYENNETTLFERIK